jgi:hypothetical protein
VIFSRQRSGRHAKSDADQRAADQRPPSDVEPLSETQSQPPASDGGAGPYDLADAPPGVVRLDLGALQVPAVDGVDLRVQADPDGVIQQVVLVHGDSALQLGVFAAPRGEGIWDEVREEIRTSLLADGAAPEEASGDYGTELRARVRTPEGPTDLRFVGVDGPRWMVRGVFQGPAAVEPAAAAPLVSCLRDLVVNRGPEAKPVREPLMLRLPKEMTDAAAATGAATVPDSLVDPAAVAGSAVSSGPAGSGARGTGAAGSGTKRKSSPKPRRS